MKIQTGEIPVLVALDVKKGEAKMNRLTIIGNLTRDPETRTTTAGDTVCNFTVAVNRKKKKDGTQETDFFRVSAWRELGDVCQKYLAKGRKVCVVGPVSARAYKNANGEAFANLEVTANDVEFLSGAQQQIQNNSPAQNDNPPQNVDAQSGMTQVEMDDDLPF